jgi:hypothetical protein
LWTGQAQTSVLCFRPRLPCARTETLKFKLSEGAPSFEEPATGHRLLTDFSERSVTQAVAGAEGSVPTPSISSATHAPFPYFLLFWGYTSQNQACPCFFGCEIQRVTYVLPLLSFQLRSMDSGKTLRSLWLSDQHGQMPSHWTSEWGISPDHLDISSGHNLKILLLLLLFLFLLLLLLRFCQVIQHGPTELQRQSCRA